MTLIKKAVVKSYDPATHKATLQVAGSLGVWLTNIRVATDIPAADVLAGRECTVLFHDPSNQDDAVIITIQGALPSGGGGGSRHTIRDEGVNQQDRTYLNFRGGAVAAVDDGPSGETEVRVGFQPDGTADLIATSNAAPHLQLGLAGKVVGILDTLRFMTASVAHLQDASANERVRLAVASPHVLLTGDAQVTGKLAVNTAPQTDAFAVLRSTVAQNTFACIIADIGGTSNPTGNSVAGMIGRALALASPTTTAYGLSYLAGSLARDLTAATGLEVQVFHWKSGGFGGATDNYTLMAREPFAFGGAFLTNDYGVYVKGRKFATRRVGVKVEDPTFTMTVGQEAYGLQIDNFDFDPDGTQYPIFYGDIGTLIWGITKEGAAIFAERGTAPPTPPANTAILYAEDNGAGKTRLVVKWPGAATTVIATEP